MVLATRRPLPADAGSRRRGLERGTRGDVTDAWPKCKTNPPIIMRTSMITKMG